jgi:hypothetical protein
VSAASCTCGESLTDYERVDLGGRCSACVRRGYFDATGSETTAAKASRPRPATSPHPRPRTTSPLRPTPLGGAKAKSSPRDFAPNEGEASSWRPLDLLALTAEPPRRPDIIDLFYAGLNHVLSGESESAKSWLAMVAAVAEIEAGLGVLWVDGDDMGAGAVLERARALGATDDAIARLFAYVAPDEGLTAERRDDLIEWMRAHACRMVVLDGFNPLLHLHGLNPDVGTDVEAFYRHVDAFRKAGAAIVLTDNVVKSKEARGAWAIGSERKKSKAEVQLGMRALSVFGRGQTGRFRIDVHKDRPGHLQRPTPGNLVLESDGDSCTWRIEQDQSQTAEGGFRPTHLMEKVSRYLETHASPRSRNQIEADVKGKRDYLRDAIDQLIAEGFAVEVEGKHRARLVQLVRPFVESEAA